MHSHLGKSPCIERLKARPLVRILATQPQIQQIHPQEYCYTAQRQNISENTVPVGKATDIQQEKGYQLHIPDHFQPATSSVDINITDTENALQIEASPGTKINESSNSENINSQYREDDVQKIRRKLPNSTQNILQHQSDEGKVSVTRQFETLITTEQQNVLGKQYRNILPKDKQTIPRAIINKGEQLVVLVNREDLPTASGTYMVIHPLSNLQIPQQPEQLSSIPNLDQSSAGSLNKDAVLPSDRELPNVSPSYPYQNAAVSLSTPPATPPGAVAAVNSVNGNALGPHLVPHLNNPPLMADNAVPDLLRKKHPKNPHSKKTMKPLVLKRAKMSGDSTVCKQPPNSNVDLSDTVEYVYDTQEDSTDPFTDPLSTDPICDPLAADPFNDNVDQSEVETKYSASANFSNIPSTNLQIAGQICNGHSDIMCFVCHALIPKETITDHLLFGAVECCYCRDMISSCHRFARCRRLSFRSCGNDCGVHKYEPMCKKPVETLFYKIVIKMEMKEMALGGKDVDSMHSSQKGLQLMSEYIDQLQSLKSQMPWSFVINRCEQYILSMKSDFGKLDNYIEDKRALSAGETRLSKDKEEQKHNMKIAKTHARSKSRVYDCSRESCPERCPNCHQVICPSKCTVNVVTYTITYICDRCGLTIYILPHLKQKRIGSRSKRSRSRPSHLM